MLRWWPQRRRRRSAAAVVVPTDSVDEYQGGPPDGTDVSAWCAATDTVPLTGSRPELRSGRPEQAARLSPASGPGLDDRAGRVEPVEGLVDAAGEPAMDGGVLVGAVAAPEGQVQVHVLGPLTVTVDGQRVAWGGSRHRALFQYLLLRPSPVHREELMELLWPEHSYNSARNNLNVCVHGLRRSLRTAGPGRDFVVYREGCYSLSGTVGWAIDRDEFLRLARRARSLASGDRLPQAIVAAGAATALYRGPLFQDDPAADWFAPERRWLHEQHLDLLEADVVWRLDLDDVEGAREVASRMLREEPCRESVHRLLMRCYARKHQGDLLVRQYQLCISTLDKQLGIAPTPETVRLYEELADTG